MDFSLIDMLNKIQSFQTLIAAIVATLIAWRYNSNKIKIDTESFKRDIFLRYNEKYDLLNDKLEDLALWEYEIDRDRQIKGAESLSDIYDLIFNDEPIKIPKLVKVIYDYLNLCSEEYYWYKKGLVDEDVWRCWHKGMQQWYENSFFIQKVISSEVEKKASYYGDFLEIFEKDNK